MIYK